jgi:hypothetical protein
MGGRSGLWNLPLQRLRSVGAARRRPGATDDPVERIDMRRFWWLLVESLSARFGLAGARLQPTRNQDPAAGAESLPCWPY